jgi:hypothetical protein
MTQRVTHLYRGYPVINSRVGALCGKEWGRVSIFPRETTCKRCRKIDPYCRRRDTRSPNEPSDADSSYKSPAGP